MAKRGPPGDLFRAARPRLGHVFYRRPGSNTIYARDHEGRYRCYTVDANGVVTLLPRGITTLGPVFGRVNFANDVRFAGHTRSQDDLRAAYQNAVGKLRTGWVPLPPARDASRRTSNQGMNAAMTALTGAARSATNYAVWFNAQNAASSWEWCHLLAHSMGGLDGPQNVVAAVRGNNSEQLAIESALHLYRHENCFDMKITAILQDNGNGRHIARLIRYKVRCGAMTPWVRFLDCLNAPDPSAIHYYTILRDLAQWANHKLEAIAEGNGIAVSAEQKRLVRAYIAEHEN